MKTPLQELIEFIDSKMETADIQGIGVIDFVEFEPIRNKATELLEKEREQIENAWLDGVSAWDSEMEAEQYYNETYNQTKEDETISS